VKRSPMARGKKRINPRSKKREAYMVGRRERVAEAVGDGHNPCQMRAPGCTGSVEGIHEVLPRGRAGGLEAAERDGETMNVCHACNEWASQHSEEAERKGWLKKARPMEEA